MSIEKIPTESMEQCRFVSYFRKVYTGVMIFAVPNGGHRGKVTAMRLKAEGVTRGVPDLYIPEWRLWIEMKRQKGGRLSKEQVEVMSYLTDRCKDSAIVACGFDDAINKVNEFVLKNNIKMGVQF